MNAALRQLYFGDGQFYELSPDDDDFQFDFDDSLFDAAAREILDNGGYTPDYLTTPTGSALINETNRAFTDAISKGLGEQPDPAVAAALRENAFIFSGFKTHAELEQVAQLLTDENGNIRPFNDFLNDVQKLNKDYNHTYLRTEYNQAVQAAQMASKWADFERDKDFINLQYRTANDERVRASHRILHGVTLPVDDKFWQQYTPPNGWGCRCTVVAVPKDDADYPVKDVHGSTIDGKEVFPTPAYEIFKTNTAKDQKLFPDKHPYLPKSCASCPLNTDKTLSSLTRKKRDCTRCENTRSLKEKVQKAAEERKTVLERRKEYQKYKNDPDYVDVEFDPKTGAVKATHRNHNSGKDPEKYLKHLTPDGSGFKTWELENFCVEQLFRMGNSVIVQPEGLPKPCNPGETQKHYTALDIVLNGVRMDIKSITKHRGYYYWPLRDKNKQLKKWNKENSNAPADSVMLYFHDPAMFSKTKVKDGIIHYLNNGHLYGKHNFIKHVYCVVNGENRIYQFDIK